MKKKFESAITIVSGVLLALLIVVTVSRPQLTTLDYIEKQKERVVVVAGLEYAKNECTKRGYGDVCGSLEYDVQRPPDWGIRSYLFYAYSKDKIFDSSMAIDLKFGQKPIVSGFGETIVESP